MGGKKPARYFFYKKKLAVCGIFYKTTKADVFFGEKFLRFAVDNE
jgi:hypothetical protein